MTTTRAKGRLKERSKARNAPGIVLPLIKEHLLQKLALDDGRDHSVIHASDMAKDDWCIKATWYRIKGYAEPARDYNFVLENILAEGTSIHEKWQTWLQETGKLWGDWRCVRCGSKLKEVAAPFAYLDAPQCLNQVVAHIWKYEEISLKHDWIVGHADGAVDDTLIELKSVGMGTLRAEATLKLQQYYIKEFKIYDLNKLWAELKRPFMSHLRQGNVYLWLCEQMGLPYKKITFVYEFKPFQQVKEFTVTKSDTILRPMLERAGKLSTHLDDDVPWPPDCEFGGCKKCEAYESGSAKEAPAKPVRGGEGKRTRTVSGSKPGAAASGPSRKRRTTAATRDDGTGRRGADEPVQPARRVVGLPGPAAQPGPGGRGARKVRGLQDRGT